MVAGEEGAQPLPAGLSRLRRRLSRWEAANMELVAGDDEYGAPDDGFVAQAGDLDGVVATRCLAKSVETFAQLDN